MAEILEIGGTRLELRPDIHYKNKYMLVQKRIDEGVYPPWAWRDLFMSDSWFFLYFILGPTIGLDRINHPFLVNACWDIDDGAPTNTLDIWGREHFKTTIISTVRPIQKILNNPEERIGIFSYARPAAIKILVGIKWILEQNELLKSLFPDVLWADPVKEAPKWSEEGGLIVKRKGVSREATLEAWGLLEGMPTGRHFSGRVYDDIETADSCTTPEQMQKLKDMFFLSANLGEDGGWQWVTGTPYHYNGLLMHLKNLKDPVTNEPVYQVREKPSVKPRTFNGKPVFLSEERIKVLRMDKRTFAAQHLLDPSPVDVQVLNPSGLRDISQSSVPKNIFKFMTIDPAGSAAGEDAWAILVCGVEPYADDLGASNVYILDAMIEPMPLDTAVSQIVEMYCRAGRVVKLGVEKVGISTMEIHIAKALRAKGKVLTINNGSLELLRPAGRSKQQRIENALVWALNNGKIFVSSAVPVAYRERLRFEMEKFPYWHDDGLDCLSYVYDLIKGYNFPKFVSDADALDVWDRAEAKLRREGMRHSFLYV